MKIIFLDIDGVLRNKKCKGNDAESLSSDNLYCLKQIVNRTNAEIVVTSTWRKYPLAFAKFKCRLRDECELEIFSKTIDFGGWLESRPVEIKEWLSGFLDVENYVVLDDHDMSKDFGENFILIDENLGLTPQSVDRAVKILNKDKAHVST